MQQALPIGSFFMGSAGSRLQWMCWDDKKWKWLQGPRVVRTTRGSSRGLRFQGPDSSAHHGILACSGEQSIQNANQRDSRP